MLIWISIAATALTVVVLVCLLPRLESHRFLDKWPAIDDDEFVRRCPSGTRRETALAVRRIVAEQLGIPYEHIYPEQSFIKDLDC